MDLRDVMAQIAQADDADVADLRRQLIEDFIAQHPESAESLARTQAELEALSRLSGSAAENAIELLPIIEANVNILRDLAEAHFGPGPSGEEAEDAGK